MSVALLSKSLASVVAVGLIAAWMSPSTKPNPIAPSPLAGLSSVKPMGLPPETAADEARAAMPRPVLASATSAAEPGVRGEDSQPAVLFVPGDEQAEARETTSAELQPSVAVGYPGSDYRSRARESDRARNDENARWARDRGAEARDCQMSPGDPAPQDCLDYYARERDPSSEDGGY